MWLEKILFFWLLFAVYGQNDSEENTTEAEDLAEGEKKLSENILAILDHFKQAEPLGVPGANITDPCPVPGMKQSVSFSTLYLKNTVVSGISKLRILYVNVDVENMEVQAAMSVDALQAQGNYSILALFSSTYGPFTVNITGLKVKARATVGVEEDGQLQAQDIHIDLSFSSVVTNFENLGFLGDMMQSFINTGGNSVFESSIPAILQEAYPKIRAEINTKLDEVVGDMQFPNTISPLDMVIIDVRKKVRDMKLDPYRVKDYNTTVSVFTFTLSNTWFTGISSFHRVGNITLKMENNTAVADIEIGTKELEGKTQWDVSVIGGLTSRAGTVSFSVKYISARIILAQPLDTRKKPLLKDINLDIGNIQMRCNGAGTTDYIIELVVNILPNLIRYQIIDALELPLKEKVQQELDTLNVEEMIKQKLPKLDELQDSGIKLSALRDPVIDNERYDEDEFFNF